MSPATTVFNDHARHSPLALAQDRLRPAFSLASSAVQPPPTLTFHPASGPTCWTFDVAYRTTETLFGDRHHRSADRYRHNLTRPGR